MNRALALITLLAAMPLPAQTGVSTTGGAAVEPLAAGLCFTNQAGLGVCALDAACDSLQECDAANPCPDGKVCVVETCCSPTLAGVCLTPAYDDPGCRNAAVCGGIDACQPVLGHEDFTGIVVTPNVVCGSGGSIFVEDACAASVYAPSPLDHARWGAGAASCASYASSAHRLRTGPGPLDVSSCTRAVLDFDYLFDLDEGGAFDRGFVTVAIDGGDERVIAANRAPGDAPFAWEGLSCAGGILPIGNLIADGAWHHFRAGIGDGSSVEIRFYAETYDDEYNAGQGWLFDDVRIDCGDLIHANGFEGGNPLSWSYTTWTMSLEVDPPGTCGAYLSCSGPDGRCFNFRTADGNAVCAPDFWCGPSDCTSNADCAAGEICLAADNCCEVSLCVPASCTGHEAPLFAPGAASPLRTGAGH